MAGVRKALKPRRHVLAGHRRRICRGAETHRPAGIGLHLPELGDLVLHVRGELHAGLQPLAHASVPFRRRSRRTSRSTPTIRRFGCLRPGRWSTRDKRANPKGRLPDNTWILRPQDIPDSFAPDHDTWFFSRVAGTFKEREGLSRLPDAGATSGADHPLVVQCRRDCARSVRRQRHDAGGGQETRPAMDRLRVVAGLRGEDQGSASRHPHRRRVGRRRRSLDQRPADSARAQDPAASDIDTHKWDKYIPRRIG